MDHTPLSAECEHGLPREARTKTGAPRCAICRRRWFKAQRTTGKTLPTPGPIQPVLIDAAALAARNDA